MFRNMLIGAAACAALLSAVPATLSAQPPTPPEVVRRIDHGVRRATTDTDRAVRRSVYRTRHHARYATHRVVIIRSSHRYVRALCNDGRIRYGRTRVTACIGHGGIGG
jgi:hypothetical protein